MTVKSTFFFFWMKNLLASHEKNKEGKIKLATMRNMSKKVWK